MTRLILFLVWWVVSCMSLQCNMGLRAQSNVWVRKSSGFGKSSEIAFSIGTKGYFGLTPTSNAFWEYDATSNLWNRKADFPGEVRIGAVGFSINSKGYVGTGAGKQEMLTDFWEYDPAMNTWSAKAPFPGAERYNGIGFSIGNKGYIGMGYNGFYLGDLWEYDPAKNRWNVRTSLPGKGRESPFVFSIGNKGYVGCGKISFMTNRYANDFWEYDQSTDMWTRRADFAKLPRWGGVAFSIGAMGYAGTGNDGSENKLKDFWEYNPCEDKWTQVSDFGGGGRSVLPGFSIGGKGFLGVGNSRVNQNESDFWEYTPSHAMPPPLIEGFYPESGKAGTTVAISGANFSPISANNTVKFNGTTAVITSSTATSITAIVPANASAGTITIQVSCNPILGVAVTSFVPLIVPPPWLRWWAFLCYGLAFIGFFLAGRLTVINHERRKFRLELERKQIELLRESEQLKAKFFSNITHEFRTPLTLIQGPVNELLERTQEPESKQLLLLVNTNANRLLKLINQLLDLTRLDAREMKLNKNETDLIVFFRELFSRFESLAASRKIKFSWTLPEKSITAHIDDEKIETILSNLIANALKFTAENGLVNVSTAIENKILKMEVSDRGRGIPAQKLEHIFDRFYQVEPSDSSYAEGTGIGLALVKEYVELMNGLIHVESELGKGTLFLIEIPITISETRTDNIPPFVKHQSIADTAKLEALDEDSEGPLLLLADDSEDIRLLIKTCLGKSFRYSDARNGREGLGLAIEQLPDLIISDLMMPEMDGLEFCRRAKKDKRTDHIPFIMLTAKATEGNKLEGLQTGAEDYLVKPFSKAELLTKVQNMILLRKNLQNYLKRSLMAQGTTVQATSSEEQFILKARNYVEAHLTDRQLSVESLADEMNLGREQFYRKLRALTTLSPSAFIRKLRLQKAAQLVVIKSGTISEIAYEVGFENLSYFSKSFKEEFGKLPSEF